MLYIYIHILSICIYVVYHVHVFVASIAHLNKIRSQDIGQNPVAVTRLDEQNVTGCRLLCGILMCIMCMYTYTYVYIHICIYIYYIIHIYIYYIIHIYIYISYHIIHIYIYIIIHIYYIYTSYCICILGIWNPWPQVTSFRFPRQNRAHLLKTWGFKKRCADPEPPLCWSWGLPSGTQMWLGNPWTAWRFSSRGFSIAGGYAMVKQNFPLWKLQISEVYQVLSASFSISQHLSAAELQWQLAFQHQIATEPRAPDVRLLWSGLASQVATTGTAPPT